LDWACVDDQFDRRVPVGVGAIVSVTDADESIAELPCKLDRAGLRGGDAFDDVGGLRRCVLLLRVL
jgi:hypothetical protein